MFRRRIQYGLFVDILGRTLGISGARSESIFEQACWTLNEELVKIEEEVAAAQL